MPELKRYGIATIRELVRGRAEASSLREVAAEIGMSWSGLRSFLEGTAPHPGTIQKLTVWYAEVKKGYGPRQKEPHRAKRAEIDAAIERLGAYLLEERDEKRRRERLAETVRRIADAGNARHE